MESVPTAADEASAALARAGHRLHRCYEPGARGFPCAGVRDPSSCPIAQGVDVALLVRPHVAPRPTVLETGVSCALRAGVPLVEKGTETLDPFTPWLTARLGDDSVDSIVDACTEAARAAFGPLLSRIRRCVLQTMTALAASRGPVSCLIEPHGRGLHVRLSGPRVGKDVENALAVRVLDAVRDAGRSFPTVDVSYRVAR